MSDFGFRQRFMPRDDFAAELGVHPRTVKRYQEEPDGLPFAVIGGKIFIPIREGLEWVERRVVRPNPTRIPAE